MSDFKLVVDWFFSQLTTVFNVIMSHWLLQLFFAIGLFGLIVSLTVAISPKE